VASGGLPMFPLGTVLFPGLVMPLTVFEERYRALVRHLLALPDGTPREFGVVAIQRGWEVDHHAGDSATLTLHEVGCSAEIRQVTEHPDGRFDLVTVGRRRFAIRKIEPNVAPYLIADVEWLDEPEGPPGEADRLTPGLLDLFQRYLRLIRPDEAGEQVPDDPVVLSHLIAATAALPLTERQALLAAPDAASRLRTERRLLGREIGLLRQVRAVPVPLPELAVATSPN
jgi:Lon protease-like protein